MTRQGLAVAVAVVVALVVGILYDVYNTITELELQDRQRRD